MSYGRRFALVLTAAACTWGTYDGRPDSGGTDSGLEAAADAGPTPITLASGQQQPAAIAIDSTTVYWVDFGDGTVKSCAKKGCGGNPTVLATLQNQPNAIAVDDASVYWTNGGDGTVRKCDLVGCGGNPVTLATSQSNVNGIASDGQNVYWRTGTGIMTCDTTCASGPTTLVSGNQVGDPNAHPIAVDANNVYWTAGGVKECALTGCANPIVLADNTGSMQDLAIDGTTVYWLNAMGNAGVSKCAIGGCGKNPTYLTSDSGRFTVDPMSSNVYQAIAGTIAKCSVAGCGGKPTTVVTTNETATALAVDATSIYWVSLAAGVVRTVEAK